MRQYIDCHAHLYDDAFNYDLDEVVSRAATAGVAHVLVVAERTDDFQRILDLQDRYNTKYGILELYPNFCLPCLGVHPVQGDGGDEPRSINEEDVDKAIPIIEKYSDQLVAIGEVGLDFTPRYCKSDADKESQRNALRKWVEISKAHNLPLNVHSRSAGRPTIALLKESGAEHVLLHAFDGKPSVAEEAVKCGYYFSIPPSIVRSQQKEKLVSRIPLENILLETDSPALGPEKQGRNEPANIRISCEYIAKVKKVDEATVASVTWQNSLKLFPRITRYMVK